MMTAYNLSAIIQLLNPDNTISAHRMLAHAIGMTETIIYSALISKQTYYSQNGMLLEGGWFFSTVYDLQESTTFGTKAQQTAIKHLMRKTTKPPMTGSERQQKSRPAPKRA